MNIEEVAEQTPEYIFTVPVDVTKGPTEAELLELARNMGFSDSCVDQAASTMGNL